VIELGANSYGKSAIRLVKVTRLADRHVLRDLTVGIALEGDFGAAYVEGDNANVIATDTMKNTVYALARDRFEGPIEGFGLALAGHFAAFDQVERAIVRIREHGWAPIQTTAGPAPNAFTRTGELTRLAVITASRDGPIVEAGIEDLTVMKTTRSGFTGFPRDQYTTLPEVEDRLMATKVAAVWRYEGDLGAPGSRAEGSTAGDGHAGLDFDAEFEGVRDVLLDVLASHHSPSVQSSIWQIGRAVLEARAAVAEIRMTLPNLHHWLVDLSPFGLTNDREIFIPTTEPHGLIEGTVRRSDVEGSRSPQR
jgi:urate oxidase